MSFRRNGRVATNRRFKWWTETRAAIRKSNEYARRSFCADLFILSLSFFFFFFYHAGIRVQKPRVVNGHTLFSSRNAAFTLCRSFSPTFLASSCFYFKTCARFYSRNLDHSSFEKSFESRIESFSKEGRKKWKKDRVFVLSLTRSLVIVDGNSLQLQIAVSMIDARLVDAVLLGDHFPELDEKTVSEKSALEILNNLFRKK